MFLVRTTPKMSLAFSIIATGLFVCIYCESDFGENNAVNTIKSPSSSSSFSSSSHHRSMHKWPEFLGDDPSIASPGSIDKSQRSQYRHRNVADTIINDGYKKHSIRQRGQRHRNNKNGKASSLFIECFICTVLWWLYDGITTYSPNEANERE